MRVVIAANYLGQICGESLCSHTAMWLRSATTALVVALADAGFNPGKDVSLADPLDAMRIFAHDPTCRSQVELLEGGTLNAIEIQRHYLSLAETHLHEDFMPPWAPQVCRHWRAILDQLDQGAPGSVATILDWAIKYALFTERIRRRGVGWTEVRSAGDSRPIEDLKQQLIEIDVRWGQLGDRGVFASLDRAGVLQHDFPGVDNFPHAMTNPPNLGRALLRGVAIKRLSGKNVRHCCDWAGVWDMENHKFLDLSRPFEMAEVWKPIPTPVDEQPDPIRNEDQLRRIEQLYGQGAFEEAAKAIRAVERMLAILTPDSSERRHRLWRFKAWVQARRGCLDGVEILDRIYDRQNLSLSQIADYLLVLRFAGFAPRPEMEEYLHSGLNRFGALPPDHMPAGFREHWGAFLIWRGQVAEAEAILERGLRSCASETRVLNRTRALLANAKRLVGKTDESRSLLEEARRQQQEQRFDGDLADFTLANLAKLLSNSDPAAAHSLLSEAKTLQARSRNRLGLIRTLLLNARVAARGDTTPHSCEAIQALSGDVPALATCQLFQRIMERWQTWTRDLSVAENGDIFWGL